MSLCVLLQRENEIYMAGDSRVSVEMEGKKYRWNDNYSKIEQVGNFVIFKGSSADVMNNIVDKFKESYVKDLVTYQRICAEEYDNYRIREGINFKPYSETKKMIVSTLIATIECNKPVVYFISDLSNFKIVKIKLPDDKDIQDVILGVRCDEAGKIYRNCTFDFGNFDNVFDNYIKIYEGVTGEEIGGTLTLFHITNEGIKHKKCGLMNARHVNEFSDYLLEKNHADLRYKGFANCDELLIRDVNILDEVNNIKGDFLSENSIGIGKLKLNELYVGTGGIKLDPSAEISWEQITGDKPPSDADNTENVLVGSGFTKIGSNYVYTGQLYSNHVVLNKGDSWAGDVNFSVPGGDYITFRTFDDLGPSLKLGYTTSLGGSIGELKTFTVEADTTFINGNLTVTGNISGNGLNTVAVFG